MRRHKKVADVAEEKNMWKNEKKQQKIRARGTQGKTKLRTLPDT